MQDEPVNVAAQLRACIEENERLCRENEYLRKMAELGLIETNRAPLPSFDYLKPPPRLVTVHVHLNEFGVSATYPEDSNGGIVAGLLWSWYSGALGLDEPKALAELEERCSQAMLDSWSMSGVNLTALEESMLSLIREAYGVYEPQKPRSRRIATRRT